jgi:hypothetical protein
MTWKKPETFGVPNRICLDTVTEIGRIHKTGTVRENREKGSLLMCALSPSHVIVLAIVTSITGDGYKP